MAEGPRKRKLPRCPTCGATMTKSYFYWYCPAEHDMQEAELWLEAGRLGERIAGDLGLSENAGELIAEQVDQWFRQAVFGRDREE